MYSIFRYLYPWGVETMWNLKVIVIMLLLIITRLIFLSGFDESEDDSKNLEMLEVYEKGGIT